MLDGQVIVSVAACHARRFMNEEARHSSERQAITPATPARYDEGTLATNHNAATG